MNLLVDYVREKTGDYVSLEILTKNLIAFLVDDQQDSQGQYTELISEFVLKNENNEKIQNGLNRIKQGSILYIGFRQKIYS